MAIYYFFGSLTCHPVKWGSSNLPNKTGPTILKNKGTGADLDTPLSLS